MSRDIDYSLPANDILWQCLEKSAKYVLNRKHLHVPQDVWDDIKMDIEVAAHKRVMAQLHEWDHKYEFSNFVYWHVWSVSGGIVDAAVKKRQWESDNLVSTSKLLDLDTEETVGDTLTHHNRLNYVSEFDVKRGRANKRLKANPSPSIVMRRNLAKLREIYDEYVESCCEFLIDPISWETYLSSLENDSENQSGAGQA